MNRGWYHHSMAHKLASKGIKTKSPFKGVFANGLIEVEPVWWDDIPDYLYHATPTENVKNILDEGLKLGEEERRSLENDIEAEEGLHRPVDDTIYFTEYPEDSIYFGIQAMQSKALREGKVYNWGTDIDYTILKIDTEEFVDKNIVTYLGATIPSEEREYFVQRKIPKEWITSGRRIYHEEKRDDVLEDTYTIFWKDGKYEIVGHWGGF